MEAQVIDVRFTREEALSLGLLTCHCGHPPNNHFFGSGGKFSSACARCKTCTGYREELSIGERIATPN